MKLSALTYLLVFTLSTSAQNALQFDGIDDYVQSALPGPIGMTSRTVEAWVKFTSISSSQEVILDWGDMANGNRFTLNIISGKPRIEIGGAGMSAPNAVTAGAWHHIAATFDGSASIQYNLYVDGNLSISGNLSVPISTSAVNGIIIGRRNDGINNFNGFIDEVRVWSLALSQSQISAGMNYEFCPPFGGLTAYYDFNQGTASGNNIGLITLNDIAGSSNNGTLHNFTLSGSGSNWTAGKQFSIIDTLVIPSVNSLHASQNNAFYQWLNCDSGFAAIPGAISQNYTPSSAGNYSVRIALNGCADTSSCFQFTPLHILENNFIDGVNIYPNPLQNKLCIDLDNAYQKINVSITDETGRGIMNTDFNDVKNISVDVSEWSTGIYFIHLTSKNKSITFKAVK